MVEGIMIGHIWHKKESMMQGWRYRITWLPHDWTKEHTVKRASIYIAQSANHEQRNRPITRTTTDQTTSFSLASSLSSSLSSDHSTNDELSHTGNLLSCNNMLEDRLNQHKSVERREHTSMHDEAEVGRIKENKDYNLWKIESVIESIHELVSPGKKQFHRTDNEEKSPMDNKWYLRGLW